MRARGSGARAARQWCRIARSFVLPGLHGGGVSLTRPREGVWQGLERTLIEQALHFEPGHHILWSRHIDSTGYGLGVRQRSCRYRNCKATISNNPANQSAARQGLAPLIGATVPRDRAAILGPTGRALGSGSTRCRANIETHLTAEDINEATLVSHSSSCESDGDS